MRFSILVSFVLTFLIQSASAQQAINTWSNAFAPAGVSGSVTSLAKSGDRVYVGGTYSIAGNEITRFAAYDLIEEVWVSIADLEWEEILALATDDEGVVYIGGRFNEMGDAMASNVAWYNPHTEE